VSVVVIGAGAAGLGTAAELGRLGIETLVLERGDGPATSWRARYDGLHLHTIRSLSGLPGAPIGRSEGRWVSRDAYIRYLERFAREHRIGIRTQTTATRIERADGGWRVLTSRGELDADAVVVATGISNVPFVPDWPGRASFGGELIHSANYRNAEAYGGRDVLVVGSGNSGAEIATQLAEGGAGRVRLSVRTGPQIARRDRAGVPAQVLGLVLGRLPPRIGDALGLALRRLSIPDLTEFGLPLPTVGPATTFRQTRQIPILDVGFVDAVRQRRIEIVAAVESLNERSVVLADGSTLEPDAVIAATGFRPGLEPLVGHLGVLDAHGLPVRSVPGLWFVGMRVVLGGGLRDAGRRGREVAQAISRSVTADPPAALPRPA
jgi:putative flavoprotein involved in K+ transport